ncbi:MAG: DNA repair protein RadA [Candidatus Dormibacteraeota bacterium]|uniref:DNA repair protein RadA n=1 Tax=Candidatus Aeolococcus gillhamiae TaxID=3127015 RepID=A0A2W5Z7K8_9BACT|nr:DNA repair protein RadA [Candidatus Dormibacteraeota bacterium]PZR78845.1 MAG: DNA repair protein RadA [Candidatus Dormibacter sp. RRmetagenome_bin12]
MTAVRVPRQLFVCSDCGATTPKWQGRCDGCGSWNTVGEAAAVPGLTLRSRAPLRAGVAQRLDRVGDGTGQRRRSGIDELDRVLGGGVVAGSLILLGGDPGIGKSTLALQLAARMGSADDPVLYCAGEESAAQVAMRAERLGCRLPSVAVLAETDLDGLAAAIASARPPLAVVDSIQTVSAPDAAGTPGSPGHVREAVARLLTVAKETGVPIVLVGHVTKDGAIAGPRTLEHMVDVVLYLEGERHGEHRLLRGVKNRFGSTGELGLFTMEGEGLRQLDAPGRAFLDENSLTVPGNVLTVTCEGTRPLVVEIQALVAPTSFGLPRRTSSGFDLGRLHLLIAVIEKRAGVLLGQADVFLNVVGGVRLSDPAVDLGVALALAGAARNRVLPRDTVVLGEVGLGGEVRRASRLDARLAEADALGQVAAVIPEGGRSAAPRGLRLQRVSTVSAAIGLLRPE